MSELDKTIEELEAEVMAELEEGMHDEDDKNEGKKDKEDLQERFKKLANIIKG